MPRVSSLPMGQPIWFDLMTSDPEAACAFYAAVLGWTYDVSGPEMGHYAIAKIGDAAAAGIGGLEPGAEWPPAWTVYFGVRDADATARTIEAAGGRTLAPAMDVAEFGRMAMCADPTGAVFALWQPGLHTGAGVVDEHGAMTWCDVNTRDAEAASAFYAAVFGLRHEVNDDGGGPYHLLHRGDAPVCGVMPMTPEWGDAPSHWSAYFAVRDVEQARAAVLAHGGQLLHGPFDTPYGRIIVVMDPQGASLCLIQLAPHMV
jgi:predicted enzyme related to lactoylglutathione lyase